MFILPMFDYIGLDVIEHYIYAYMIIYIYYVTYMYQEIHYLAYSGLWTKPYDWDILTSASYHQTPDLKKREIR